jgi:predicted dehydrogenase
MYNIAIIGAGQLGSRHLQGLKKANLEMSVFVVDTNQQSLDVAKERYMEIENNPKIRSIDFLIDIDLLPSNMDIVIIATNSIPRASVAKQLLKSKKIANIIFEKFLFPSVADYSSISKLLANSASNAWVNCTRRLFPFYRELKKLVTGSTNVKMNVSGYNWGMACNSIHFIDIFAMLTGKHDFEINTSSLENIIDSKRSGYIELTGIITGKSTSEDYRFSLISKENYPTFSFDISTEKYRITVFENLQKAYIDTKDGNRIEKEVKINFQSELTGIMAEQILLNGQSYLTPYAESADLHIRFLRPVINFYNIKTGENKDFCPIT